MAKILRLLVVGGDHVSSSTISSIKSLLVQGYDDDEVPLPSSSSSSPSLSALKTAQLREFAIGQCIRSIDDVGNAASSSLIQLTAWILGQYGGIKGEGGEGVGEKVILAYLLEMMNYPIGDDSRFVVINALIRFACRCGEGEKGKGGRDICKVVEREISKFGGSRSIEIQQISKEFCELMKIMKEGEEAGLVGRLIEDDFCQNAQFCFCFSFPFFYFFFFFFRFGFVLISFFLLTLRAPNMKNLFHALEENANQLVLCGYGSDFDQEKAEKAAELFEKQVSKGKRKRKRKGQFC